MTKPVSRGYAATIVKKVLGVAPHTAVVRLGHFCVVRNVPAAYIAQRMGVSRTTVYTWFTGTSPARAKAEAEAEKLLAELQSELQ